MNMMGRTVQEASSAGPCDSGPVERQLADAKAGVDEKDVATVRTCPRRSSRTSPWRDSRVPVQRLRSHWPRSHLQDKPQQRIACRQAGAAGGRRQAAAAAGAAALGSGRPACMVSTCRRNMGARISTQAALQAASHSQANWERALLLAVGAAAALLRSIRLCALLLPGLTLLPPALAPAPASVAAQRARHCSSAALIDLDVRAVRNNASGASQVAPAWRRRLLPPATHRPPGVMFRRQAHPWMNGWTAPSD